MSPSVDRLGDRPKANYAATPNRGQYQRGKTRQPLPSPALEANHGARSAHTAKTRNRAQTANCASHFTSRSLSWVDMASFVENPPLFNPASASLPRLLEHQAERIPHHIAWKDKNRQLTFGAWHSAASACANRLIRAGVRPGDTVGIRMAEGLAWPVALFAIWQTGATALPLHLASTPASARALLTRAQARWVLVDRPGHFACPEVTSLPFGPAGVGNPGPLKPARGSAHSRANRERLARLEKITGHDVALLAPTSGTTGTPRLAMLTHANLLGSANARANLVQHQPGDLVLSWLPLTHLYALNADIVKGLLAGVTTVRLPGPRGILRALRHWRPTHFQAVPYLYLKIWRLAGGPQATPQTLLPLLGGRLRWAGCGGAPLGQWCADFYARCGIPILEGYGLTEASPLVTMNTPAAHAPGTAGRVVPGMEVKLAEDGEILVRGVGVMHGYYKDTAATSAILRDGWLHTGDLGSWVGYFLRIHGRKSETIVLSTGRKVQPARVEAALLALPWVEMAVVVGEGDSRIRALIWPRDGVKPDWQLRHLPGLEDYEQPARLIPLAKPLSAANGELTPLGKVRRDTVHARYRSLWESSSTTPHGEP